VEVVSYRPIGIIHSPFKENVGIPRQAVGASDIKGSIEIFDDFSEGLKDLDGFSHIVVIFDMHMVKAARLKAYPPWDGRERGVFATRSPYRPNPIGVSVVCLESVNNNILNISGIDMADGSPVLDIKPYVPDLNPTKDVRIGWLTDNVEGMNKSKSGDR
jgi:tRNA-Thr(GGU) m(6)t(6)A37 methyltransferase TsaA